LFSARDGQLVIAVGNDSQWTAACLALGLDELATDPLLRTNAGRLAQRDRVVGTIAARLTTADSRHWLGALESAGIPCGVVRSVRDALGDFPSSPVTGVFPSVPGTVRRRPPRLDEHGAAIRGEGWRVFHHK
jgi:crotonobetainyl-CoA:carnitine CoA-transferase CaiB-like acyl-CoA transferase